MPRSHAITPLRRLARLAVAWLIAIVLPLQGLAAAAMAVRPLHVHAPVKGTVHAKLIDFRRTFAAPPRASAQTLAEAEQGRPHMQAERHAHALSDASVVEIADPLSAKRPGKADGEPASFIAILPAVAGWVALAPAPHLRSLALWSPTSADARLPERPPRQA